MYRKRDFTRAAPHAALIYVLASVLAPMGMFAKETALAKDPLPATAEKSPSAGLISLESLPDYSEDVEATVTKHGRVHVNGLVSTINYKRFKKVEPAQKECKIKLRKEETGFRRDIELSVFWQPHKAPLAVLLLGFYQQKDQKLARAWQTYLYASGCHVLTFDSIFRHETNAVLGYGVAGNMTEDAKAVIRLIQQFLEYRGAKKDFNEGHPVCDRIEGIRLLGTSYGGIVALNLYKCAQAKEWPIDRILVLSAPVRTHTAALRLDRFQREDRPRYEIYLLKLIDGYTPERDQPADWEESLMRAGIAYEFQGVLENAVKENEKLYLEGLLNEFKKQEEDAASKSKCETQVSAMNKRHQQELEDLREQFRNERCSEAHNEPLKEKQKKAEKELEIKQQIEKNDVEKRMSKPSDWNFTDFVNHMTSPYWELAPEAIWAQANLEDLLKDSPPFVQAIVTEDDPLNDPEELKALKEAIPAPKLIVLPHGGHLGYTGAKWIRAAIEQFFGTRVGEAR